MTILIKHAFTSLKGDGTDATQVQPSHWNAGHAFTMATAKLLGRLTAGAGVVEEISLSSYMASLLNAADAAALAALLGIFETGDVKYTFKTTAAAGWLLVNAAGSIGTSGSGATLLASTTAQALYTVIYNACSDAIAPVSGGRSGVAATDFSAGKTLTIPQLVGRAPVGAGSAGTGTSARTLGSLFGAETYTMLTANLPPYTPVGTIAGGTPNLGVIGAFASGASTGYYPTGGTTGWTGTFTGTAQGGTSSPFNISPPSIPLNAMVKL